MRKTGQDPDSGLFSSVSFGSSCLQPALGALLAGLLTVSTGCGEGFESAVSEPPPVVQQALTELRPRTCQEIKNATPSAPDGDYTLYLFGDPSRPWKAYCHTMASSPAEYLSLPEAGLLSNYSQYTAGGASGGTSVRTSYSRIRIDPITLRVNTNDRTFSTSIGLINHGSLAVTSMPYGRAMSCDWGDSGRGQIDLRGTPFKVAPDYFTAEGWYPWGSAAYSFADQVVALRGGGYCGSFGPPNGNMLDGATLPLFYEAPPVTWTPTVRVYPTGGSEPQAQTLQPGWYDLGALTVGNDAINSVHVPRGWNVTLYEHGGFSGTTRSITGDTDLTGSTFDKQASSVGVEAPVLVYTGNGYQGQTQRLFAGRYDMGQLKVGNDAIRSVKVPAGFQVTLYEHAAFGGQRLVLTQDTDLAGQSFNAQTSSIVVESTTARHGNILYGRWSNSGGQSTGSPANRQILVEYTGGPDVVTFDLESHANGVNPYLYLLDSAGQVLLEKTNWDGGTHARISYVLSPGTYKLVAATAQMGMSGEFTLRSDKARLRYPQRVYVQAATSFNWVYDDRDTGAHSDVSVWRPNLSAYPGYYSLGDVGMPGHGQGPRMTFVVSGEGDVLARPLYYNMIWGDWGSGGTFDVGFWDPVPPAGYTCLGSVAALGYDMPSTDLIRCVKSEYVLPANIGWVWDDSGSGADNDITLWQAEARDHRTLTASTMVGQGYYGDPNGGRFWALNKSALANPELQGGFVDEVTAMQYAPRVWLHGEESYWPSSTEFFLPNMHKDGSHLWTNQSLGCDSCTDPAFLDGQRPDRTHVPVYAQIVTRTQGGAPTNVTDIIYWTFYPYNNGKRVCIGFYVDNVGCIGGYSTFGNHVGDWEHMTVRFVDGRPSQVYMSQHSGGDTFTFGSKAMSSYGFHTEAYAALGSHGLYPDAARHTYQSLFNGDTLNDDTSRGIAWNTWDRPVVFYWQPVGTFTGDLQWLNISEDWGNDSSGCNNIVSQMTGVCVLNSGPTAPLKKGFASPSAMTLE